MKSLIYFLGICAATTSFEVSAVPLRYWICTGFNWNDYHEFCWDLGASRMEAYSKTKKRCKRKRYFCDIVCEYQNP